MKTNCALAVVVAGILAAGPAVADKPAWAGGGKGDRGEKSQGNDRSEKGDRREQSDNRKDRQRDADDRSRRDRSRSSVAARQQHFEDRHRAAVHEYYDGEFRRGRCPPGLAKKDNGCMPPGQAKKWNVGQPLPRQVIFHNVPQALAAQIGPPPAGQRYVRVDSDILLISSLTGMVMDAVQNLGRN